MAKNPIISVGLKVFNLDLLMGTMGDTMDRRPAEANVESGHDEDKMIVDRHRDHNVGFQKPICLLPQPADEDVGSSNL